MKTYPEMNETVKDLLRRSNEPMSLYILARLEELENQVQELTPPNAPLTLEELREMDGGPVWCEKFEWRICYGVSDFRGCLCMETGAGSCIQLNDYGKTWRAYRRKPEEGTP